MRLLLLLLNLFFFSYSFGQDETTTELENPMSDLPRVTLENSGFEKDSIANLVTRIRNTQHQDFRGMVVIKNNQIVIEEYFNTFWKISIHDIRSAGKSITAMLLGIAMKEGLVESLDQNVHSFFPKEKYPSILEDYKKIKLKHLLDMSSGLDADSDRPESIGHAVNWMAKDDWKAYLLKVPLKHIPGEKWVYADINALLIGAIIEETSGMSLKDFAKKNLFDPLGIVQFYWYTNASNQTGAAGNLYLSTLDFAKLGLLISNQGKWKNKQLIAAEYIKKLSERTFNLPEEYAFADAYGMMWYKADRTFNGKDMTYLFASGNGGNHLIVIPEKEIVIALTSSAYGQGYAHRRSYTIMSIILNALK